MYFNYQSAHKLTLESFSIILGNNEASLRDTIQLEF